MSAKLSVEDVLANLEQRAAYHREQEAFHAQQEIQHREQRAVHQAELETVEKSLEAFRAVAATAVDLARPAEGSPDAARVEGAPVEEQLPPPGRLQVSHLIWRIVATPGLAEPFGPSAVAAAFNRRYARRLHKTIPTRTASDVLRRMLAAGHLELARKGRAVHEALYQRVL
jgi:hypothetical protein